MSDLEIKCEYPACGSDTFYLTTNMEIHLGTKTKWHCTGCDYGYVHIMDGIETYTKAEA